ncbi:MAG TPA: DUF882 domain-containing protein [Pseudolabrys sp.]
MRILIGAGARVSAAGFFLLGANSALQNAVAEGDTRTISFHHVHTGEDITITYKRDGRYDDAALKKLDWFMRDWRKQQSTRMDPHLFDLLWETYREVGGTQPIQVVCGYRSPQTNAMLRARSTGVAQVSQHTAGHAMDFYIPGVPLAKVREVGLQLQRGGVGFYPTSGSPFVHMDTGSVRHWPRMTYAQLSKVFPSGRTVHMPSDGHPLPGYALALAEVERRGNAPNTNSLEAARTAGVITASQEQEAENVVRQGPKQERSLLASLFNFGKQRDTDEASDDQQADPAPKAAQKRGRMPTTVASLAPPTAVATERVVRLPASRPKQAVQVAMAAPAMPQAEAPVFATASTAGNIFDARGIWQSPLAEDRFQGRAAVISPFDVTEPATTGSTGNTGLSALAYAEPLAPAPAPRAARVRPMGEAVPQLAPEASVMPASDNTSVVAKPPLMPAMALGGQNPDSLWLRAAVLTPSVSGFMTATRAGEYDPRPLQSLFYKPSQSVMMSFSADPSLGMFTDRFSGNAVVFLATATFTTQTTASLR